jgi:D-alanyl-D-alanine dipeptidase
VPVPEPYRDLLANGTQIIVVNTPGWNAVDGVLSRFEKRDGKWQQIGDKFPIVVGKNGLAWDGILELPAGTADPVKKEGDGRSPAGIFRITELFGFAPSSADGRMKYRPLTDSVECVDDPSSMAYNDIVDRKEIPSPDWNSSEKMRTIEVYKEGAVVGYNEPSVPGAGSCIFMHIWNGPGHGTAGCTAMDEKRLQEVTEWLDSGKQPLLLQFPAPLYERIRESWQLP